MVKPGTPRVWRRVCPELRKHRPEAMLKEKERKMRRGDMVDMGVRRQAVVQCSAMKPLIVVSTTHGHPKSGDNRRMLLWGASGKQKTHRRFRLGVQTRGDNEARLSPIRQTLPRHLSHHTHYVQLRKSTNSPKHAATTSRRA